jgi:hypothetical protein
MSRLKRRVKALGDQHREPETALKLLTTDELRRASALAERGGVLPSGDVRHPEVYQEATAEGWIGLCGEPLDHLDAAEELLDRMGEAYGWRSPETIEAAVLLQRMRLPDASPWFVAKRAEAVVSFYAEMDEHRDEPRHAEVRGAVRRLERLEELAGGPQPAKQGRPSPGSYLPAQPDAQRSDAVTLCTGGFVGRTHDLEHAATGGALYGCKMHDRCSGRDGIGGDCCRSCLRNLKPERANAVPTKVVSCPPADIK